MEPVLLAVALPVMGSVFTSVYGKSRWTALLFSGATLGLVCALIPQVGTPREVIVSVWMNPIPIRLLLDGFSVLFSLLISFLFFMIFVYSSYIQSRKYYSLLLLDLGVLLLAVFSKELLLFYVFLEIYTIVTYFLIVHKETEQAVRAGFKYLVMNVGGALLILSAIVLEGSFSLVSLLFIAGCLIKIGSFPVHVWLADAHPAALSPISALLSGAMVKVGAYGLFRFSPQFGAELSFLVPVALASMVICVFLAMIQVDIKRLLAYSTVSQVGYVLLGMVLGTEAGAAGGILHFVNHGLFKALLFLCMGCVIYSTGERNIRNLRGLYSRMPVTAAACLVGCLSISGIPPFNGFVSKSLLFHALESDGVKALFMITCAGTVASFTKLWRHIFLGEPVETRKVPLSMKVPLIILSGLCIVLGIFPGIVLTIMGYPAELAVWNSSCLLETLLGVGLGITLYVVGLKTKIIFRTPPIKVLDKFFSLCGRSVEYASRVLDRKLTLTINYYAAFMVLFLVLLYFLQNF